MGGRGNFERCFANAFEPVTRFALAPQQRRAARSMCVRLNVYFAPQGFVTSQECSAARGAWQNWCWALQTMFVGSAVLTWATLSVTRDA